MADEKDKKIAELEAVIKVLSAEIAELKAQPHTDSGNSSKPPSKDGFDKPAPKSLRGKSGKKPGGQKGHKGNFLSANREPDEIIDRKA